MRMSSRMSSRMRTWMDWTFSCADWLAGWLAALPAAWLGCLGGRPLLRPLPPSAALGSCDVALFVLGGLPRPLFWGLASSSLLPIATVWSPSSFSHSSKLSCHARPPTNLCLFLAGWPSRSGPCCLLPMFAAATAAVAAAIAWSSQSGCCDGPIPGSGLGTAICPLGDIPMGIGMIPDTKGVRTRYWA